MPHEFHESLSERHHENSQHQAFEQIEISMISIDFIEFSGHVQEFVRGRR